MNRFFYLLKEYTRKGYKKEFIIWLVSLVIFIISIFSLITEAKRYLALSESKKKIEESLYRLQPEISTLRKNFEQINWQRDYQKFSFYIDTSFNLTHLPTTLTELSKLTSYKDTYFIIYEMSYQRGNSTKPILILKGELITFK